MSLLLGNQPSHTKVYKMNVVATAYTPSPRENGGRSITAIGTVPRKGVIAVDPKKIPLGSRVYIPGYGWAKAEDTGGKIKGHRIDVCLSSRSDARRWGRQKIEITVYSKRRHPKK